MRWIAWFGVIEELAVFVGKCRHAARSSEGVYKKKLIKVKSSSTSVGKYNGRGKNRGWGHNK